MKICILTSAHSPFDNRIFHKEAKTLLSAGYEVSLIARNERDEEIEGIQIIAVKSPGNRLERMFVSPWRILGKALKQRAGIYHFHDPELFLTALILKLTGKKVIYDVHEDYKKQIMSKPYLPEFARKTIANLTGLAEKISARFFDGIVSATDDIHKIFSVHKNAEVVKNLPVLSSFDVRLSKDKTDGEFQLIYAGSLVEIRGISQLIEALGLVPEDKNIRLALCGTFRPPGYEITVRNLKGFERVNYMGWIDLKEIPEEIAKSDIGMVLFLPEPNHVNSMPNKLFEYMAAGLPVIASNFPLWQEIIERNKCGITVDPYKPEKIAEAINYLMENPELCKQMGENGRQAVANEYNWQTQAEILLTMYRNLL